MLTGTGQRNPPCSAVSSARSRVNVQRLMTANPSRFGATTRSRPNGSLRTTAAIRVAYRSPAPPLCRTLSDPASGMTFIVAALSDREPACRRPAGQQTLAPGDNTVFLVTAGAPTYDLGHEPAIGRTRRSLEHVQGACLAPARDRLCDLPGRGHRGRLAVAGRGLRVAARLHCRVLRGLPAAGDADQGGPGRARRPRRPLDGGDRVRGHPVHLDRR